MKAPPETKSAKEPKPYHERQSVDQYMEEKGKAPVTEDLMPAWKDVHTNTRSLAGVIRFRRKELGLTQAVVAQALDIKSSEFIGMVENGYRSLELNKIPRLAHVLELNRERLCRLALFEHAPQFALSVFGTAVDTFVPANQLSDTSARVEMAPEQIEFFGQLYALPTSLRQYILDLTSMFTTLVRERPNRLRTPTKAGEKT
jgi:transcriptional regulator with XRE-family HTH domain